MSTLRPDPVQVADSITKAAVDVGDATNKAIRVNMVASVGATTFFGTSESFTATVNYTSTTLGHTPTDEPRIFVDGLRQYLGLDYTRAGALINWLSIPAAGSIIVIDYTWSMASASLPSTLIVDINGNIQPTGDSAARPIHVVLDTTLPVSAVSLPLPANASRDDSLRLLLSVAYAQLVRQQASLAQQSFATGQFIPIADVPAFLAGA